MKKWIIAQLASTWARFEICSKLVFSHLVVMFLLLTLNMWFPVGKLSSVLLVMSPFFFPFNPSIPILDKKKKINLNFLFLHSLVSQKALITKKCKHKNLTYFNTNFWNAQGGRVNTLVFKNYFIRVRAWI